MTAKEMFEKLGFTKEYLVSALEYKKDCILYYVQNEEKDITIDFWLKSKTIFIGECATKEKMEYEHNTYFGGEIDMDLLQAINKQVEELEWNK